MDQTPPLQDRHRETLMAHACHHHALVALDGRAMGISIAMQLKCLLEILQGC